MELKAGELFAGRYQIEAELGAPGGFGRIYRVFDVTIKRQRALKVLHPHLARDERQRQRFEVDAIAGSRFDSDHLVQVLDRGVDEASGVPWMVMELLRGENLEQRVQARGALSLAEAGALFSQLGEVLGKAHAAGVIHQDIKPGNIMLLEAGGAIKVKLLDFGIARFVEVGATSVTVTAEIGSPAWMAPEQGETGDRASTAADVWSLGLVAFFVLTGKAYWLACNTSGPTSKYAVHKEVWFGKLVPPSERGKALGVTTPLPEGFDGWFSRCVVRDPKLRFTDAAKATRALLDVLRPPAPPPSLPPPVLPPPVAPTPRDAPQATEPMLVGPRHPAQPSSPPLVVPAAVPAVPTVPRRKWILALGLTLGAVGVVSLIGKYASRHASRPNSVRECPAGSVRLSGGTFTMGDPQGEDDEKPPFAVSLAAFCMDRMEVSVEDYRACVNATGPTRCASPDPRSNAAGTMASGRHPVTFVDAFEAQRFCVWLGGRLPTEAEWEYSAREPDGRRFPWGETPFSAQRANAAEDDHPARLAPVDGFREGASPSGVVNLLGNVAEWTASPLARYPDAVAVQVVSLPGDNTPRVFRGGSYDDPPSVLRSTNRDSYPPSTRQGWLGFRCAYDLSEAVPSR